MDTIGRVILTLLLAALCMCDARKSKDTALRDAWAEFKAVHGSREGVYDISYGDRFGDGVIVVSCVSARDRARLVTEVPQRFRGFLVHLSSPIWGIGGLLPSYRKSIDEFVQSHPTSRVHGTRDAAALDSIYAEAEKAEADLWDAWPASKKATWLRNFINAKRTEDPAFANCGDKYL